MKKKYTTYFIIILLIILITTLFLFFYINKVQKLTIQNTLNSLREITKQDVSKINSITNEHKRILETIISEIEKQKVKTPQEVFEIYFNNLGSSQFSRIAIMYKNGETLTSDGQTVDLSNEKENFFIKDEIQISKNRQSKVDEKEINIYSKTAILNNEKVVILLVTETSKYEEILIQSIYNGNGYEYITTNTGNIIAKSQNSEENFNNGIYEIINDKIDNTKKNKLNIEKMERDLKTKKSGELVLYKGIGKYFVTYQKLEVNDWYLILVTQGSVVAQELNQVVRIIFVISIMIISMILIFSIYIVITEERKNKTLYNLAYIDKVTKLGNYNYFNENGKRIIEHQDDSYILVLDIDKFKTFNKKYGHKLGDKLLYNIGEKLLEILPKDTLVCRIANDFFGIILANEKNIDIQVQDIIKKLSKIIINEKEYIIFVTLGIYKTEKNKYNLLECFDKALIAHENAKGNLEKQYYIYSEALELKIEKEQEIENIMQQALENEEFEIYYQPKILLKDEKMVSAEALVRWNRNGKILPPNEFIPIFEKNRFIIKLDKYILEKVCQDISKWKKEKKNIPIVSVNLSKEHFYNEDFIEEYIKIIKGYQIESEKIELEITESATLSDDVNIISIMKRIKQVGFKISLDDFGTGTSTLNMLQDMPIDTIKIDKSFVDKIRPENKKKNIIEYIIYIAKKLNLETVAEGVENKEQIEYLRELGCDLIQGYYYSKPIKLEEFEKWL